MIDKTILHYKILAKLGEGGMGVVYLAQDTKLNRDVAIKFLPRQIAANADERERFKIEAQSAAALNHAHIATIYNIEKADDEIFIVMEYIDGQELVEKTKSGSMPSDEVIRIGVQVAKGLQAAHTKGIVHRDIKPANIMLTSQGEVKIMDFGLAKLGGQTKLTKAGTTLGTVAYMSPEQARGAAVDHRSDIWSFGVMLYEMLTGQMPFPGDYEQAVIYGILNEEPAYPEGLPANLMPVVKKALTKDPEKRYQEISEMLSDLEKAAQGHAARKVTTTTSGKKRRGYQFAAFVFLALVIGANYFWPSSGNQTIDSIAVLPLDNLSGSSDQDYVADGMTEALITDLSKLHDLKVISRTSVMQYKDTNKTIPSIARELGVDAVVVGSVLADDNQVRISAQLVEAKSDKNIWSESYDRNMTNILGLQREIALAIVENIKDVLSPEEQKRMSRQPTDNSEAYQLYLKGRYHWNRRSTEGFDKGISYFQQAVGLDSTFAQAYAGLGDSHLMLGVYGIKPPHESMAKAKDHIEKALGLDSGLAEAYATLADINIHYDWDMEAAEANVLKAIELNPQYSHAYHWYTEVFVMRGEFERAYDQSHRALALDPYSLIINAQLGRNYRRGGEFQKALDQLQKTLEFDSTFIVAHFFMAMVHLDLGQYDKAVDEMRKAHTGSKNEVELYARLGLVEGIAGNLNEALKIENEIVERAATSYVPARTLALVSLGAGRKDQALSYLEEAYEERDPWLPFLGMNPMFASLREEPRFQAILAKVKAGGSNP